MRNTIQARNTPIGDAVFNASRQVWLASLGAAVVSREWAQAEGGNMFRTLVKEGTAVESRTIRMFGRRLENSFTTANSMWRQARSTVSTTVRQAADTAVALVQTNLPKSLPKVALPAMLKPVPAARAKTVAKKRAGQAKRGTKARVAKPAKRVARKAKAATKK